MCNIPPETLFSVFFLNISLFVVFRLPQVASDFSDSFVHLASVVSRHTLLAAGERWKRDMCAMCCVARRNRRLIRNLVRTVLSCRAVSTLRLDDFGLAEDVQDCRQHGSSDRPSGGQHGSHPLRSRSQRAHQTELGCSMHRVMVTRSGRGVRWSPG